MNVVSRLDGRFRMQRSPTRVGCQYNGSAATTLHRPIDSFRRVHSHRPSSQGQGAMRSNTRRQHHHHHHWEGTRLRYSYLVMVRPCVRHRCLQLNNNLGLPVIGRAFPAARPGHSDSLLFDGINPALLPDVPHYAGSIPPPSGTMYRSAPRRR